MPARRSSQPEDASLPSPRQLVAAPRDYFLGPMFAATRQTGPREVTIGNRRYQIGGFHPMRRDLRPPALDVRHARAIFSLLSFRNPLEPSRLIRFSFNELCRRYARSNGGRYARTIAEIVADLLDAYIRVTDLKSGITHEYRLIERIDIEKRPIRRRDATGATSPQTEMWFNGATLSPEFYGVLDRIAELQHLDLDAFTSIRSPLAQAVYLYIPSRAYHHDERKPFEITVSNLLLQVSMAVPVHKSLRKQLMRQREERGQSILQQLDGLPTLTGTFRVSLAETADQTDWKLLAWIERPKKTPRTPEKRSKLADAYLGSGGTQSRLDEALANVVALNSYELELLEAADVKLGGNERFFEMAKTLLGESPFDTLLAEAKGDHLEGRAPKKSATARLIYRIMEAVSRPKQPAKGLDN